MSQNEITPEFKLAYPDLSHERKGNTGTEGVWHFDSGKPGKHVLLTALIHGNELCGAWALKDLLALNLQPTAGQLTIIFCNLAAYDRFDPKHYSASRCVEEDMNRVWSDDKLSNPTTLERQRAVAILPWVKQADWLLDFHSMSQYCAPLQLSGVLERNIQFARGLGNPEYIIADAGHSAGVRLRDYGRFGDPSDTDSRALLIECGFHGDPASHNVALDIMLRFLVQSGVFQQQDLPTEWLMTTHQPKVLTVTEVVTIQSPQFKWARPWKSLDSITHKGSVLGWDGDKQITSPYDNCYMIMPATKDFKPGQTAVRLASVS